MRTTVAVLLLATACAQPAPNEPGRAPAAGGGAPAPSGRAPAAGSGAGSASAGGAAGPPAPGGSGAAPGATAPPPAACAPGPGKTYDVGDGKPYRALGDVPFERLRPGDTVRVHWRAEPYREKILLSASGTRDKPIRLCGVPGPRGQLPVVSGDNATTRRESIYPYAGTQDRGLVVVTVRKPYRWGDKPSWIAIENLELRSAYRGDDDDHPLGFTDAGGKRRAYSTNAASIFIERGEHIAVRNCVLHDSAYGLFVASGNSEEVVSREILVEGNWIYGNGTAGTDRRHNVYTEAAGIVFQGNRFGPQRAGARGNQIKDRSAGTIVRYNWIEGGAHLLDLVEPEEAAPVLVADPRYRETFVYGNVMISGPRDGSSIVHYGGDNGVTKTYRKGTLYFFHNTVVIRASDKQRWNTALFRVETDDETVDARNNIIWNGGTTHLYLMKKAGQLTLGTNWISSRYGTWQYADQRVAGTIRGEDRLLRGDAPGFVDAAGDDFRLAPASKARGAGGPLADAAGARARPPRQYVPHRQIGPRASLGRGADLGAFGDSQ